LTYQWDCRSRSKTQRAWLRSGNARVELNFHQKRQYLVPLRIQTLWQFGASKNVQRPESRRHLSLISSSFVGRSRLKAMPVKAATLPNGGLDNGQIGRECLVVDGAYISLISKRLVLTVSVFRLTLLCALTGGTSIYLCHSLGLALRLVSPSDS
jgi:hypothetical protein